MPRTITDGHEFPMPCPRCTQVAGIPFIAGTTLENNTLRVGMRCRECGHEWRYDLPVTADLPVVRPKPDRRSA